MVEEMPMGNPEPENKGQERGFEYQAALAQTLLDAVKKRNDFIQIQGGFDTFAEAGQYFPGARETYDQLEKDVEDARGALETGVSDKAALVKHIRESGNEEGAQILGGMLGVETPKGLKRAVNRFFKGR